MERRLIANSSNSDRRGVGFRKDGLVQMGDLGFWGLSGHGSWAVVVGNDLFERLDRRARSLPPPPTVLSTDTADGMVAAEAASLWRKR